MLVRAVDLRFKVAVGQKLHRALQRADPAQDVAADIEPDEQHRPDQGQGAERQHHRGRKRNLASGLPGRGVGLFLYPVDELLHADAEADIELAGFVENDLAVVIGVELLLAQLEDAGLALAERHQFQRGVFQRVVCGVPGERIELRFDARLHGLEFLLDGVDRVAAVGRKRRDHLGRHQMAAGDDIAELLDAPRGLRCVIGREIGGLQDAIGQHLGLGIHRRELGCGNEACLSAAQCIVLLATLGRDVEPLARGRAEALDGFVDVLHSLVQRRDHGLVGAELDDFAEFCQRALLGFRHLLGALVQRLVTFGGQKRRPLAGEGRALRGKLQAGREPGNVPSAQVDHASAEMPQHHGGAGADDDRHAGDHCEGGEQAASDSPSRPEKAEESAKFADHESHSHNVPAR